MNAIDTNILIYAHDPRDSIKMVRARELVLDIEKPVLLWQVACEFLAASRKLKEFGFDISSAEHVVSGLRQAWATFLPSWAVFELASVLRRDRGFSLWDSLIVASCLEGRVHRLYSEDLVGFGRVDRLEIVNPFADDHR